MKIGTYIQQLQGYKAFIPVKFPPNEVVELDDQSNKLLDKARWFLGKLDGITQILPDLDFFIFMYARKEAALSSMIEGTKATMIDAISAEAQVSSDLPKDVEDIFHYIQAMNFGLKRLETLPLSLRLIREVHNVLLTDTAGGIGKTPGEFRTSQNWIGGATLTTASFVPPPVYEMNRCLDDFENFLHAENSYLPLVKTALMHAQFETIHPFLDGNGRTGRLLTTFYLCQQGILERPVLYLSEYFKKHRELYFDLLNDYHSEKGNIVPWINFFLEGVIDVAEKAIETAKKINKLRDQNIVSIQSLGASSKTAMKILQNLYMLPIVNVKKIGEWTGLSRPSANLAVKKLMNIGILEQKNLDVKYGRIFEYKKYLKIFE